MESLLTAIQLHSYIIKSLNGDKSSINPLNIYLVFGNNVKETIGNDIETQK